MNKIHNLVSLLLLGSLLACSGGSASSEGSTPSTPDAPSTPAPGNTATLRMTFVQARAIPSSVTDLRFTGRDVTGAVVFGPETRAKADSIELAVPITMTNLQIEYLAGGAVVGTYGQAVVLSAGATVTIKDPNFADVGGGNSPVVTNALDRLNQLRQAALLDNLTEVAELTDGCTKHALYMVKNNTLSHAEDPSLEAFTEEGARAAQQSNLFATTALRASAVSMIDQLMTSPFHGPGFIDPRLHQTGIGYYTENLGSNRIQTALAVDVLSGFGTGTFPVLFPSNGAVINLRSYEGGEVPDPLAGLSGYSAPTGPPLYIMLGSGAITPDVSEFSVTEAGGGALAVAEFDETNYVNPNAQDQATGRAILNARDTIVLLPNSPLVVGKTYDCALTVNGQKLIWSFSVTASN